MNDFYVYGHYKECPVKNPLAVPYYIGKGYADRLTTVRGRSQWHQNVIRKYGLFAKKIFAEISEPSAHEGEIFLIKEIGRKDKKQGELINATDGGDGVHGLVSKQRIPCILVFTEHCEWFISYAAAEAMYGRINLHHMKSGGRKSTTTNCGKKIYKVLDSNCRSVTASKKAGELKHEQYNIVIRNFRADNIRAVGKSLSKPCFLKHGDGTVESFDSFVDAGNEHGVQNSNLVQMAKGQGANISLKSNKKPGVVIIGVGYSKETILVREKQDRKQLALDSGLTKETKLTYSDGSVTTYPSQKEANEKNGFTRKATQLCSVKNGRIARTFSKAKGLWIVGVEETRPKHADQSLLTT